MPAKRTYVWVRNDRDDEIYYKYGHKPVAVDGYVYSSVDLALAWLDTGDGFDDLLRVARDAVWRTADGKLRLESVKKITGHLPHLANIFMAKIWANFFPIRLDRTRPALAKFQLHEGGARGIEQQPGWCPVTAGVLSVNRMAVEGMIDARYDMVDDNHDNERDATRIFERHQFTLAAAIARELVESFIASLSGTIGMPISPPLKYPSWGCVWQRHLFGGMVVDFEDPKSSLGAYQPGYPWLILRDPKMAFRITRTDIVRCVDVMDNCFPLKTGAIDDEVELCRKYRTMGQVRADAIRGVGRSASFSSSTTSSTTTTSSGIWTRENSPQPARPATPRGSVPRPGRTGRERSSVRRDSRSSTPDNTYRPRAPPPEERSVPPRSSWNRPRDPRDDSPPRGRSPPPAAAAGRRRTPSVNLSARKASGTQPGSDTYQAIPDRTRRPY